MSWKLRTRTVNRGQEEEFAFRSRIWGKELKGVTLSGVCWSPDARLLLFSMASGEVHVYDSMGGFVVRTYEGWN